MGDTVQAAEELVPQTDAASDGNMAIHFAEYGAPPKESWDDVKDDTPGIPLEATLLWPDGEWDEGTFVAENMNDDGKPHD